jgi:predicted Fe-Mo cluster-binding NifX family protein
MLIVSEGDVMVKIAVCSKDFERVSGHAGQAKNWLLYEVQEEGEWRVTRVVLEKAQVFHHHKGEEPHPLGGISALIAISAGESFLKRMQKGGVDAVMTAESEPRKAVADYLANQLSPPKPRPIGELFCKVRDLFSEH